VSLNRLAISATNHCLTGCGIGEVLGMVLATSWGWGDAASIALVADTLSIATMELVDNAILLVWPGALDAGLRDLLFWASLAVALAVAWGPTFLVNRALIRRGKGHARAHAHGHAH